MGSGLGVEALQAGLTVSLEPPSQHEQNHGVPFNLKDRLVSGELTLGMQNI